MVDFEKIAQERIDQNAFMRYAHVELTALEAEWAECRLTLFEEAKNPRGMIHGGAMYTLADNAAGSAAHSDGRKHVTQTGSMNYLRNITEGTAIATAKVRHRGRTTCLVDVEITAEATGKLLSTGTFTFFCIGE